MAGGRGAGANAPRQSSFQSVDVQALGASAAQSTAEADTATRLLLPPGFSTDTPADAIAINGNATSLDRGLMNDRFGAIGRGEIDPVTGGRRTRNSAPVMRPVQAHAVDLQLLADVVRADAAVQAVSPGVVAAFSAGAAFSRIACLPRRTIRSAGRRSTAVRSSCGTTSRRPTRRTTINRSAERLAVR